MAHCAEFWAAPWLQCVSNFARLSLQWIKRMATIHDEIDTWLAADLLRELSNNERSELHGHLVDCAACRKTHQATKSTFPEERKAHAATVAPAKTAQSETGGVAPDVVQENAAVGKEAATSPVETPAPELANRKLIRNATVELEIVTFDNAVQKIIAFANEEHGYVATTDSEKQANGKLRGQVVVKVLPENLDRFLQKIRSLGELKKQTLGTEDVTKAYFDTDARLKNAHVMEQRLIDMLKI